MNDLLQVQGLCKAFPSGEDRIQVLESLDLTLPAGRMLAVTGASGSGKSTLLHLLGGMEKPDSGTIRVEGREISQLDSDGLAGYRNRTVGFVFQSHYLLAEFSALENVMFPLLLRGEGFKKAGGSARIGLEEVGLGHRSSHRPGELSGGEQQRVALARALVGRPRLILADEPTGDLDDKTSEAIRRLLSELHGRHGWTSVIVTHDPLLASLCDEERKMVGGRLVEASKSNPRRLR